MLNNGKNCLDIERSVYSVGSRKGKQGSYKQ